MSRGARIFWIFTGLAAVFVVGSVGAVAFAAHAVTTMPMIEVSVQEHGASPVSFHVSVPAAAVGAGLAVAPHVIPDDVWQEARGELDAELEELPAEWRDSSAELIRALRDLPDAVLVEVDDRHDHVRVEKRGSDLRVTVRSSDADVDVTVPIAILDRVADFVAG